MISCVGGVAYMSPRANTNLSRYLIRCYGSWVTPCLWTGSRWGRTVVTSCTCHQFPLQSWVSDPCCWQTFSVISTTQIHNTLDICSDGKYFILFASSCYFNVPTFCYPCIPKRWGSMWALSQTRNFFPGSLQPQSSIWYQVIARSGTGKLLKYVEKIALSSKRGKCNLRSDQLWVTGNENILVFPGGT